MRSWQRGTNVFASAKSQHRLRRRRRLCLSAASASTSASTSASASAVCDVSCSPDGHSGPAPVPIYPPKVPNHLFSISSWPFSSSSSSYSFLYLGSTLVPELQMWPQQIISDQVPSYLPLWELLLTLRSLPSVLLHTRLRLSHPRHRRHLSLLYLPRSLSLASSLDSRRSSLATCPELRAASEPTGSRPTVWWTVTQRPALSFSPGRLYSLLQRRSPTPSHCIVMSALDSSNQTNQNPKPSIFNGVPLTMD